jgi:hypothetical protein
VESQRLNNWLAVLTNLTVIAGVFFLAYEIHQNTIQLRSQASYNLLQNRTLNAQLFLSNDELLYSWMRARSGEALTEADNARMVILARKAILNWHWEWGQYVDGNLSHDELPVRAFRRTFHSGYGPNINPFPDAWEVLSKSVQPEFVDWMEANVINN